MTRGSLITTSRSVGVARRRATALGLNGGAADRAGRDVQVQRRPRPGQRRGARQERAIRARPDRARLRDHSTAACRGRSPTSVTTRRASAWRCCSTSAAAWKSRMPQAREAASARALLARRRRRRSGRLHVRHAARRSDAVHGRPADAARSARRSVTPFGATSLHDAIARTGERMAATRRPAPRRRRVHRRPRQRQPPDARRGLGIASAIDVPVYILGIVSPIDNPVGGRRRRVAGAFGAGRPAERPGDVDRRAHLRRQHACAQRSIVGAADRRRAAPSVPHRVRIERHAGLAPARGPRARQRSDRQGPEWVYRGAISPDLASRRTDHVPEIRYGVPARGARNRRVHCLRDQEVRAHECRRGEREGRFARPLGRGDAGAHAPERRQDRRRRSEGAGGRPGGPGRAQAANAGANNARTEPAANAANAANAKARSGRQGVQAPGLRSRAERGSGQLQVRQDRSAGRSQGQARRDDRRR